jgi:signal transduction histidine kinase
MADGSRRDAQAGPRALGHVGRLARGTAGAKLRLRALVVDDDRNDAELLARELARGGYDLTLHRVDTGADMRRALAAGPWDIILCDYVLPGFGAAAALAIVQEGNDDIPFIVVSGTIDEVRAVEILKAGAHDFVLKDQLARLLPAIGRELREAEIRRERRQALEDLKSAVRVRDDFLSIASHELRTPLTSLSLQIDFTIRLARGQTRRPQASGEDLGEEIGRRLERAAAQAEKLAALIDKLLDVTRMTSGHLVINRQSGDLTNLVVDVVDRARASVAGSAADIAVQADVGVMGCWDLVLVETVVTNLVSNAIKFGAGKPVAVTVSMVGSRARLTVADQGIGIPTDAQRRIFERFERANPADNYGGFGLGLWIVREVVEAHGGTIDVSSSPGVGTTFVVELPSHPNDLDALATA